MERGSDTRDVFCAVLLLVQCPTHLVRRALELGGQFVLDVK